MMAQREPTAGAGLRVVADTGSCYPDWAAVYADNAIWVYRMIVKRIGNVPDAEDLTAEVFLAALRPLRTTATVAQVRGYLRAITRSVLAAHWRQTTGCDITSIDDVPDLPDDTGQLTFKTLQTYSDGKTVRWIDVAQSGADEPENPAPVLKLTAKGAEEGSTPASSSAAPKSADSSASSASGSDSTARGLGVAGLVVGVLGLAAAAFAIVRNRSAKAS